jgi:hypothetical protein
VRPAGLDRLSVRGREHQNWIYQPVKVHKLPYTTRLSAPCGSESPLCNQSRSEGSHLSRRLDAINKKFKTQLGSSIKCHSVSGTSFDTQLAPFVSRMRRDRPRACDKDPKFMSANRVVSRLIYAKNGRAKSKLSPRRECMR